MQKKEGQKMKEGRKERSESRNNIDGKRKGTKKKHRDEGRKEER